LVLATGFDHRNDLIEGLPELEKTHESDNVFVHMLDTKERADRNYYHGWNNANGNLICYSPKFPYKGEGTDCHIQKCRQRRNNSSSFQSHLH